MKAILNLAVSAGFVLLVMELIPSQFSSPMARLSNSKCKIKGNISYSSEKKLYHLPGMKDYQATVIDRSRGERWFCSESEAIFQGWRKAPK